ncbi:glycosyltransferase family 4 protein [Lactococcus fujiensis]|nr:glycosyltransferase family 4 protein [Lactococcus fujiensis]
MKNIVLLMYNFPPLGAGRGIAWTYFCEQLSKNYNVTVFTVEASEFDPFYNADKLNLITENYQVNRSNPGVLYERNVNSWKNSAINPATHKVNNNSASSETFSKKLINKTRKILLFPDSYVFWNKNLEEAVLDFSKDHQIDLIISVGFPFSTHLAASKLQKKLNTKLILDYGDPWSFNPSTTTIPRERQWFDKIVEGRILRKADFITVTTENTKEMFKKNFPFVQGKIDIITQGVFTKDFYDKDLIHENESSVITMFYAGTFYKDIRNPSSFFEALLKINQIDLKGKKVKIIIAGNMEDYVLTQIDKFSDGGPIEIKALGNLPFDLVADYQKKADALLFFGNYGGVQVPGKIFEYLATDRPIYGVIPKGDESERIINRYDRGIISDYDEGNIKASFINFIDEVANKKYNQLEPIKDYDWKNIAEKYEKIVGSVLG